MSKKRGCRKLEKRCPRCGFRFKPNGRRGCTTCKTCGVGRKR